MQKQIDDEWITDRLPTPYKRVKILYRSVRYHKDIETTGYYSTGKSRGWRGKSNDKIKSRVIGWKKYE